MYVPVLDGVPVIVPFAYFSPGGRPVAVTDDAADFATPVFPGAEATVMRCATPANIGTESPDLTDTAPVAPLARTFTSTAKPGLVTTIRIVLVFVPAAFLAVNFAV